MFDLPVIERIEPKAGVAYTLAFISQENFTALEEKHEIERLHLAVNWLLHTVMKDNKIKAC